jgi:carbon-monoxide dehydrogenase medium subunit
VKPAPFSWHAPPTVADAVATLAEVGHDGKILAGGQSLIPVLAMRLAEPSHLIDINSINGLDGVEVTDAGVRIGALVRHAQLLDHPAANRALPLLGQALSNVAHATIRNRGTTVGSLTHADPSGEMTAVLALTGGTITAVSSRGSREIEASDFFLGPLECCLEPDELATHAFFPAFPAGSGTAFVEMARRHGDYALSGVAAAVTPNGTGTRTVRCAFLAVSETPVVVDLSQACALGDENIMRAAREAINPEDDIHASAEYRRHIAGFLAIRAIREAMQHATAGAAA